MPMLYEKYAPKALADFVGNGEAVARLQRVIAQADFDGGMFLIHGPSGCGKTTLANILAGMFAKQPCNIERLQGVNCGIEAVSAMIQGLRYAALGGGFRCVVIDEAHRVTPLAFDALKTLLDNRPRKTIIALTTDQLHKIGDVGDAMFSRPIKIKLSAGPRELEEFASYLQAIAKVEGLAQDRTLDDFRALVNARKFNLRDCLTVIEADDWADALADVEPELTAAADLNKGKAANGSL